MLAQYATVLADEVVGRSRAVDPKPQVRVLLAEFVDRGQEFLR